MRQTAGTRESPGEKITNDINHAQTFNLDNSSGTIAGRTDELTL